MNDVSILLSRGMQGKDLGHLVSRARFRTGQPPPPSRGASSIASG